MSEQHDLARRYVQAMQRGDEGEEELVGLFHEDAEYVESFTGQRSTHRGRAAIREWFRASWSHQPPDIALTIERLDIDRDRIRVSWTCDSSAFATPSRGVDTYVVREGRIARLETVVTTAPTLR